VLCTRLANTPGMASLRFLMPALLCLGACTSSTVDSVPESTEQPGTAAEQAGTAAVASPKSDTRKKASSKSGVGGTENDSSRAQGGASDIGAAGAESIADPPPPPPPPPPPAPTEPCDLDGSCVTDCKDRTVTCGVESTGVFCEFEGFKGATAEVSCNQRQVIGMACCGDCDCVLVEVFFDGTYCWQGVPECKGIELHNRMFLAHAPTTPNDSFTPIDGSFRLGAGGFAGADAQGGGAGLVGTGSAGSAGSIDSVQARGGAGNGGSSGSEPVAGGAGSGGSSGSEPVAGGAGSGGSSGSEPVAGGAGSGGSSGSALAAGGANEGGSAGSR